jgi:hypothetical protein
MKQVEIINNLEIPTDPRIEYNKNYTLNTFSPTTLITPSEGYDYMNQITLTTKINITTVDMSYAVRTDESFDDSPLIIPIKSYISNSIFKTKHIFIGQTVQQYHIRLLFRKVNLLIGGENYQISIISAMDGPVSYLSDYDYYYLDVQLGRQNINIYYTQPWRLMDENNNIITSISNWYHSTRGGIKIGHVNILFRMFLETSKFNMIYNNNPTIEETESINSTENKNPDLDITIVEDDN